MAFRVIPTKRLKGPQFRVLFEKVITVEKNKYRREARTIPKEEWGRHGFHAQMTLEEAQKRRDDLNANEAVKRVEGKRQQILEKVEKETAQQAVLLNELDLKEFEESVLPTLTKKAPLIWQAAKRVLCEVKLEPKDWERNAEAFYKAFAKHGYSRSYVQKLMQMLNRWGIYISRKYNLPFLVLPAPNKKWRNEINESFFNKERKKGNKESAPLTPELLDSKRDSLPKEQALWLDFSIWFGLRPIEVDSLTKLSSKWTWHVTHTRGTPVLWVYQSKLKGLEPAKRTKGIPCITPKQKELVSLLMAAPNGIKLVRPIAKIMRDRFGTDVTKYGGRKGFIALMRDEYKQEFEDISAWLGHQSLEQTYAAYFNKRDVKWKAAG